MKRITKQETLPALAVPEVLSVPELAYPARLGKRAVVQVLRKADVKKAALAVGGTALLWREDASTRRRSIPLAAAIASSSARSPSLMAFMWTLSW